MNKDEIRKRLELVHGSPKRSLGQNFLINDNLISKIIEAVQATRPQSLIEIGPGLGALTDHLKDSGIPLLLIEMDRAFAAYWRDQGVEVIEADALKVDWSGFERDVLVSNLPYQISASIVIEQSIMVAPFRQMILMFQKEVAQRIRSAPNADTYGMLSVISQVFWATSKVAEASPRDFYPAPKIASRVLLFEAKENGIRDKKHFLRFVKAAFEQRRKKLNKSMATFLNNEHIGLEEFKALCNKQGHKETVRAQELTPVQFVELYQGILQLKG